MTSPDNSSSASGNSRAFIRQLDACFIVCRRVNAGVRPLKVSCLVVRVNMLAKSLLLVLVLCLSVSAVAQQSPSSSNGKLEGRVSDPLGVVPDARIIIKGKRLRRELSPQDDGTYSVRLPPGIYSVRFTHPGFLPVRKRVRITRDAVTRLDARFRPDPKYSTTVY